MGGERVDLAGLEPALFWAHFEKLTTIPRSSPHAELVWLFVGGAGAAPAPTTTP